MIWLIFTILSIVLLIMYCFLIIGFTVGWRKLSHPLPQVSVQPKIKISVVIPVRNEEKTLVPLLKDLVNQEYPTELYEIIIVDDHSEDKTVLLAEEFIFSLEDKHHIRLVKLSEEEKEVFSKKGAITLGVSVASGELIVCTDGDCRVSPVWLSNFANCYETGDYKMIAGPVVLTSRGFWGKVQGLEFLSLVVSGAGGIGIGKPFMCNGANLGFKKSAFHEVKGYSGNEEVFSGDDVFLMHKIKSRYGSGKITFLRATGSMVTTDPTHDIRSFFRQRIRWAGKSVHYQDGFTLFVAGVVFILNSFISLMVISSFFSSEFLMLALVILLVKMVIDLQLLLPAASEMGISVGIRFLYIPLSIFYPFYVMITGLSSLIIPGRWKGR